MYRKQVNAAFEETVNALRPEDRNVLRSYYAQQMTIDEIAAAFGIHRATAARRVNSARDNCWRRRAGACPRSWRSTAAISTACSG